VIAAVALIAGFALWRAAQPAPVASPHVVKPAPPGGASGGVTATLAGSLAAAAAGATAGAHTIAVSAKTAVPPSPAEPSDTSAADSVARAALPSGKSPDAPPAPGEPPGADRDAPSAATDAQAGQAGQAAPAAGTRHGVDPSGIMSAVQTAAPAIKECYAAWHAQQPGLAGAVKVAMTIGIDPADTSRGKVIGARIANSELQSAAVQGCLLNALDALEFERPKDGNVEVTLPFRFDVAERRRATKE